MQKLIRPQRVLPALIVLLVLCRAVDACGAAPTHDHTLHSMSEAAGDRSSFFGHLLKTYTPRQLCMNREQAVVWLHLISDALIALAYFTIPVALLRFVRRRTDLAFNWMFVCFAVFILACGLTHVMNFIAIWTPYYRLDGIIKAITAVASIGTAIALWRLIPAALLLPSPSQLRDANAKLEDEVAERRLAQERLRGAHDELEHRVRERTAALEEANASERYARAEAERASQMKDEFLATLSHELRTPLNAILGWATLLKGGRIAPTEWAQGLDTIDRNARSQAKIIEDLLDMSGIISGKVRLDVQRVSAEAALRAAVETMTPAANAKGITIETAMDPLAGPVMGDAARLQQVFWNLLSNAIKFTPAGGRASVSLNRVGGHIEISVADTGEGIPPAFLPHVFDRFRQSDASITRRHGGLGLGLAIVKQLVELHGGSIRARSDGEGHGATFIVSLPVASPDRPEPAAAGSHPPTAQGDESAAGADHCGQLSGVKVLVVDDEPDALALVTRLLEHCDARVTTATTAAEAMEKLQLEQPDVLVSDVGMPNEDGYAFIRRVRLLPRERGGAVPAIALTAYARAEDRMKAIRAGFQMHVPKPVEPAELITMVASLAGRSGG